MSPRTYVRAVAALTVVWWWVPDPAQANHDCRHIFEQEHGFYGSISLVEPIPGEFCSPGVPRYTADQDVYLCSNGGGPHFCTIDPAWFAELGITWNNSCDGPLSFNFCTPCNEPSCKYGHQNGNESRPSNDPAKEAGDPIDVATGHLEQTATDLDLGGGLRFTRHYSSEYQALNLSLETTMGAKWRHSLLWGLVRETGPGGEQVVRITQPFGAREIFVNRLPLADNTFGGSNRGLGSLAGDFAGDLVYTDPSGTKVTFDSANLVEQIAIHGEAPIQVTHVGATSTFSNGNATLTIQRYTSGFQNGKIQQVSGGGITINYEYQFLDFDDYDFVALDKVKVRDPSYSTTLDRIVWDYDFDTSLIQLDRVQRTYEGTADTLGEWTWNLGNGRQVTTADEDALDQKLKFVYSSDGDTEITTVKADATGDVLATVESDASIVQSIAGVGGPGYKPTTQAVTTTGSDAGTDRWKTRTDLNGNTTLYENHDDKGRPGRIVAGWDDNDSSGTFSAGDGFATLTEYSWHPTLNQPLTVTRPSNLPGQPDAVTTFDYDTDGNGSYNQAPTDLVYARIESGATLGATGAAQSVTAIVRFTYDAAGRVLSEAGPRTGVNYTEHVYDPGTGYRTATRRYLNGPSSSYLETTFSNFDSRGNPQTVTDANGRITTFTYDSSGRVASVTPPWSGTESSTIEIAYNADGQVDLIEFPNDSFGQPYSLDLGYNDKGKLLFVADSKQDAIVYEYGTRNRRIRASLHRGFVDYSNRGTLVGDAKFAYDLPGELFRAFNQLFGDPSPVYSEFEHDANGNTSGVVDENGKEDSLLYDALDRLIEVQQIRSATYATEFAYDPTSNVTRVTDAAGKETEYLTDDFGRLVKVISLDTGTTVFNYDEAGNLTKKIEAFGTGSQRETNFTYDGLDRLLTIDLPTNPDWTFTYDTDAAKNQKGRLAKTTNGIVTTDLEYTARGQLAKEATTYNARRYDVLYTFDAAGNIATIQTPSGTVMTYRYAGSRVSEVDVTKGTRTETIRGLKWLPFGPLDEVKLPPYDGTSNVVTLDRSYNFRYQLEELDVTGPSGAILDRSYRYTNTASPGPNDPGPNLDKLVDSLDASESRYYFYDELDRLSRATDLSGANLFEYGHDAAGNRTFKTDAFGTTAYSYETGTDRLATATGAEQAFYAHDAFGNRIYSGSTPYAGTPTYAYNEQNRLIQAVTPQGTINAVYDAFGRRVAWQTLRFVYDPAGRILEVSNRSSGLWWGDLVWVEGELLGRVESTGAVGVPAALPPGIARFLPRDPIGWMFVAGGSGSVVLIVLAARRRSPRYAWASASSAALTLLGLACAPTGLEFYWVYTDQIGFPVAMTNTPATPSDAEVIWRASYEPFGLATEELDPDGDGKQVRMPMRFPGQWWDYAANTHDNGFRTYDPATGRYLEPDPLGQQGSLNVYSYAFANPLRFVDPRGDRPLSEAERNFAVDYFGVNFNLDGIDLDASRWLNWPNAIRPGDIRLPSDYFIGSDPCADVNLDDSIIAALFAHELLHEWQRQHGASVFWSALGEHLVATFTPGSAYDYEESEDPQALLETFLNGGVEQQGQIWQNFVRTERKNLPTNKYREVFHRVRGY